MSRLPLMILLVALACQRPAPLLPPTPAALGAELATFHQVLVPLTPETLDDLKAAIAREGIENVTLTSFRQSYVHGSATVNGKKTAVFVAYSGPWQAPKGMLLRPMSVHQYLRAFAADAQTDLAMLTAPKGNMFFTRDQLPEILGVTRTAGASSDDLPFALISGSGR